MKFILNRLALGDRLWGKVEEILPGNELLMNFDGDLIRVQNEAGRPWKRGDRVEVIVRALEPLRFQLNPHTKSLLDVSV